MNKPLVASIAIILVIISVWSALIYSVAQESNKQGAQQSATIQSLQNRVIALENRKCHNATTVEYVVLNNATEQFIYVSESGIPIGWNYTTITRYAEQGWYLFTINALRSNAINSVPWKLGLRFVPTEVCSP